MELLTNQTADGSGDSKSVSSGGYRVIRFRGNFDSCKIMIQADFQDGNWVDAMDSEMTKPGFKYLQLAQGMNIRAVVSDAGGSTNVSVDAR